MNNKQFHFYKINSKNMCDSDFEDDEYEEEPEETKQIQQKFMDIINEMTEKKIEFPKEYKVYYLITEYHDRGGRGITLQPFVSQENAELKIPENKKWEGKYGISIVSTIVSCDDVVNLDHNCKSANDCGGASFNIDYY